MSACIVLGLFVSGLGSQYKEFGFHIKTDVGLLQVLSQFTKGARMRLLLYGRSGRPDVHVSVSMFCPILFL